PYLLRRILTWSLLIYASLLSLTLVILYIRSYFISDVVVREWTIQRDIATQPNSAPAIDLEVTNGQIFFASSYGCFSYLSHSSSVNKKKQFKISLPEPPHWAYVRNLTSKPIRTGIWDFVYESKSQVDPGDNGLAPSFSKQLQITLPYWCLLLPH